MADAIDCKDNIDGNLYNIQIVPFFGINNFQNYESI